LGENQDTNISELKKRKNKKTKRINQKSHEKVCQSNEGAALITPESSRVTRTHVGITYSGH
jgi:hypothetical protein